MCNPPASRRSVPRDPGHLDDAARAPLADGVGDVRHEPPRGVVTDDAERRQALYSGGARLSCKALRQCSAYAAVLPPIEDGTRDLGLRRILRRSNVLSEADPFAGRRVKRDHRVMGDVIDLSKLTQLFR